MKTYFVYLFVLLVSYQCNGGLLDGLIHEVHSKVHEAASSALGGLTQSLNFNIGAQLGTKIPQQYPNIGVPTQGQTKPGETYIVVVDNNRHPPGYGAGLDALNVYGTNFYNQRPQESYNHHHHHHHHHPYPGQYPNENNWNGNQQNNGYPNQYNNYGHHEKPNLENSNNEYFNGHPNHGVLTRPTDIPNQGFPTKPTETSHQGNQGNNFNQDKLNGYLNQDTNKGHELKPSSVNSIDGVLTKPTETPTKSYPDIPSVNNMKDSKNPSYQITETTSNYNNAYNPTDKVPELQKPISNYDDKTTKKPEKDVPLFIPLNDYHYGGDKVEVNAPKRETNQDNKPKPAVEEEFPIDIRLKDE